MRKVLVARCNNRNEWTNVVCSGELRFEWGMSEAACRTCGGRCGVAVADWVRVNQEPSRDRAAPSDARPRRTCGTCGWTSWHPTDVEKGYCGHCHDWTPGEVTPPPEPLPSFALRPDVAERLQSLFALQDEKVPEEVVAASLARLMDAMKREELS